MTRLAIIFADGFADWEVSQLTASARSEFGFEIVSATPGALPVTSMGGLRIAPDAAVESLDPAVFDGLVICGGTSWERGIAPELTPVITAFSAGDRVVGAICAATLSLGRAGILDSIAHTSNGLAFIDGTPGYHGHGHYVDTPQAVRSGRIVTAPGTAPVTFTTEIYRALGKNTEELEGYMALFGAEHQPRAA